MSKIVILDVDGVLLNWRDTYVDWLLKFKMIANEDSSVYHFKDFIRVPGDPDYRCSDSTFADTLSEIFNQTYLLSKLPPQEGAVAAIRKLNEAGYVLKVISSYTTQYEAMKSREYNLKSVFGSVFQEITSLPLYSSKAEYLNKQDKNAYYIEDHMGHLRDAINVGFNPDNLFLIKNDYNFKDWDNDSRGIRRINWDNVVDIILHGE